MNKIAGLLTFIAGLLLASCGGPTVQHSSINGEVRQIELWKIDYSPTLAGSDVDSVLLNFGEVETIDSVIAEHSYKYVRDVEYDLEKKGYLFTHDLASQGRILLKMQWLTRQEEEKPRPGVIEQKIIDEERERRGLAPGDSLSVDSDYLAWKLFGEKYVINRLNVTIFDSDGKQLGEVFLKTEPFESIDPDFTARVIDKIISEGKY